MNSNLRYVVSRETGEIADRLLGEFLLSCLGKNDMSVACAMITAAVTIMSTHCQRTGQDFDELIGLGRSLFDSAAEILHPNRGSGA